MELFRILIALIHNIYDITNNTQFIRYSSYILIQKHYSGVKREDTACIKENSVVIIPNF